MRIQIHNMLRKLNEQGREWLEGDWDEIMRALKEKKKTNMRGQCCYC